MKQSPTAITSRSIAAIIGGFICANLLSMALVTVSPGPKINAVLLAMCSSFVFYAAIVLWVFAVKNAKTFWLGLSGLALLSLAIVGASYL